MSEPNSLYVNITIKKERLEQFFQNKPEKAAVSPDWIAWWDSREMYGPQPLTDIQVYTDDTNRKIAEGFLAVPHLMCDEDQTQPGVWTFSALMLSENYEEILPTLAWLKSIANFMEPEDEGFAIIYNYFWAPEDDKDVMAHLVFKDKQAFLKLTSHISEIEPALVAKANAALKEVFDKHSAHYND